MPLIRPRKHAEHKLGVTKSSRNTNPVIIRECTCGRNRGYGASRNLAYIVEECRKTYHGNGAMSSVPSPFSLVVCLVPGCGGMRKVRYDVKTCRVPIIPMYWKDYKEWLEKNPLKDAEGIQGVSVRRQKKEARRAKKAQS